MGGCRPCDVPLGDLDPVGLRPHDVIVDPVPLVTALIAMSIAVALLWSLLFRPPWWPVAVIPSLAGILGAAVGGYLGSTTRTYADVSESRRAAFSRGGSLGMLAFAAGLGLILALRWGRGRAARAGSKTFPGV